MPIHQQRENTMKQYLLSVWSVDGQPEPTPEAMQKAYADVDAFNAGIIASGAFVFAGGLHPASSATVIRVQDGRPVTTDGPFAETREHLGGFWVIKAPDLDAALEIAERGAIACGNPVEVRPFQEEV